MRASDDTGRTMCITGALDVSSFGVHSWEGAPSISYRNTTKDAWGFAARLAIGEAFGAHAIGVLVELPLERHEIARARGYFDPYNVLGRYEESSGFVVYRGSIGRAHRVHGSVLGGVGLVFARQPRTHIDVPFW
jgi:hypothetical protein